MSSIITVSRSIINFFFQVNFFLHNLAQMRFTNDPGGCEGGAGGGGENDPSNVEMLSFIPRTYTMAEEGRILRVSVHNYQKRYRPHKLYVYILRVERQGHKEPCYLFRSYKEFSEFHQKLCLRFPMDPFHS